MAGYGPAEIRDGFRSHLNKVIALEKGMEERAEKTSVALHRLMPRTVFMSFALGRIAQVQRPYNHCAA